MVDFSRLQDVVGPSARPPANRRPRLLASLHGPLRRTFSGSTWHYAQAAMNEAVVEGAFLLSSARVNLPLNSRVLLWKLREFSCGEKWAATNSTQHTATC